MFGGRQLDFTTSCLGSVQFPEFPSDSLDEELLQTYPVKEKLQKLALSVEKMLFQCVDVVLANKFSKILRKLNGQEAAFLNELVLHSKYTVKYLKLFLTPVTSSKSEFNVWLFSWVC